MRIARLAGCRGLRFGGSSSPCGVSASRLSPRVRGECGGYRGHRRGRSDAACVQAARRWRGRSRQAPGTHGCARSSASVRDSRRRTLRGSGGLVSPRVCPGVLAARVPLVFSRLLPFTPVGLASCYAGSAPTSAVRALARSPMPWVFPPPCPRSSRPRSGDSRRRDGCSARGSTACLMDIVMSDLAA